MGSRMLARGEQGEKKKGGSFAEISGGKDAARYLGRDVRNTIRGEKKGCYAFFLQRKGRTKP